MKTALIAIMLGSLGAATASADETCRPDVVASVPMIQGAGNLPTINVLMNDSNEQLFVDTAGYVSLISPRVVDALELPTRPYPRGLIKLVDGRSVSAIANVQSLNLGGMKGENVAFYVIPAELPAGDAGTFGAEFLSAFDVEFDFGGETMKLHDPKGCDGTPVYWTKEPFAALPFTFTRNHHIRAQVMLDGKPLRAIIDTGTSVTSMSYKLARELYNIDETQVTTKAGSDLGDISLKQFNDDLYDYEFKLLTLGNFEIREPRIDLLQDANLGGEQLIIGMSVLEKTHMYVSYKRGTVYLTAADAR